MTERPDPLALELVVRAAEGGSVGAAARAVGITQPQASRAIARLERRLGLTLLARGPRGSRLTPQGEVVVAWAREALDALDRIALGAAALAGEQAGGLDVVASLTVAEHLAPGWLARLRRLRPDAHVRLEVANSAEVVDAVRSGRVPLGFVEGPTPPGREVDSTIVARDALVVVAGPGHPWARRRGPVGARDLVGIDLVLREAGSGTRETLVRALALHGLELGASHLELASTAAVKAAAAQGAVAVLSELAVASEIAAGTLVAVPTQGLNLDRALRAVWPNARRPEGIAADLLRLARQAPRPPISTS